MISQDKKEHVLSYLRNTGQTYNHLLIWENEAYAEFDGKDAMIEIHSQTKQVVVVVDAGLTTYNYKEIVMLGGIYTNKIYYALIL